MSLKNEFVPYEQALALKELGYTGIDLAGWCHPFKNNPNPYFRGSIDEAPYDVSAPLHQQAFSYLLNHKMIIDKGYQLVEESRGNWGLHQEKENHFELILSGVPKIECLKKLIEIVKNK